MRQFGAGRKEPPKTVKRGWDWARVRSGGWSLGRGAHTGLAHNPRGTVTFASQDDAWKRNPRTRMDHAMSRQLHHGGQGPVHRPASPVRTPGQAAET